MKKDDFTFETNIIGSERVLINVLAVVNSLQNVQKSSLIALADLYVRSQRKCQQFYVFLARVI